MSFTKNFTHLSKSSAPIAGGKGASLGEMTNAGIPVPPGFVVLSDSFEQFLKETDLIQEIDAILRKVNHKEIHTVEAASEAIRALILNAAMPNDIAADITQQFKKLNTTYVAVRSSATAEDGMDHAWAGQLESYLNTTEDQVLTKVQLCWSSLFTPRAIFYRFEKGLDTTKISVAVVVQKMVASEVSGIAFSVHPVTEDYNQLIIEAGFGLGEAIVSGSVTPDSYVVEKEPRKIIDINISTQDRALYRSTTSSPEHGNNEWITIPEPQASSQVLTEPQILELSDIILTIERHYGFPCDIEWAYEVGKFYVVQSRPITTLQRENKITTTLPYNNNKDWVHYLTRPFSLFGASLWHRWYFSKEAKQFFGVDMPDVLFIEEHHNVVRHYRVKDQLNSFKEAIRNIVVTNPDGSLDILKKALSLNIQSEEYLKIGADSFVDLQSAVDFLISVTLHSTIFPYWAYTFLDELKIDNKEILELSERLRGISYYPQLMEKIIIPLAKKKMKSSSFSDEAYNLLTISEILEGRFNNVLHRLEEHKKGRHFVYQNLNGHETVLWTDDVLNFVMKLENIPEVDPVSGDRELLGQTAFKGKVQGVARIVLTADGKDTHFNEGDILVSISSNPNLMALIEKSAAIVTDEGGVSCHAAIISRELKKPCVVGTKVATSVIKEGDVIEVDADKGIVRILNK